MKYILSFFLLFLLSIGTSSAAYIDQFYYDIGGGALSDGVLDDWQTFSIDLDAHAGSSYSCGDFDLDESIKSLVKDLSAVPDQFEAYIRVAAFDLLQSLIAIAIQRAAPGVYEFLNNSFLRHKEFLELKVASCERTESLVANGEIKKMADFSKMIQWQRSAQNGESVQDAAESAKSVDAGIPWVGGTDKGGYLQESLKLTTDSVKQGYETLVNKVAGKNYDPQTSPILKYFPAKEVAVNWSIETFGDKTISLKHGSSSQTGSGLSAQISMNTGKIEQVLNSVITNPSAATVDQLNSLSTPNYRMNLVALRAIAAQPAEQQVIIKKRLASEISTLQNIEKAFVVRDLLVSGINDPHIYFSPLKGDHYDSLLDQIDNEIRTARDRAAIRKEFVGDLLVSIFDQRDRHENQRGKLPSGKKPVEMLPSGAGILK